MDLMTAPSEPLIRLVAFSTVFVAMAVWELVAPRRSLDVGRLARWLANLGLLVIDTVVVRVLFPAAAVGAAVVSQERGWGLLNLVPAPAWVEVLLALVVLDLAIYGQHVLSHRVPLLWRLHRVHHADPGFDVTTGIRFHPVEIVLSMLFKLALVTALGASPLAVLVFEVLLNAATLFNHSNVRMLARVDRVLRWLVVTPDMHRVHHSVVRQETDSNFGFSIPWWDHLFRTYRDQPAAGHEGMTIGLERFRAAGDTRLDRLLLQPIR